MSKTKPKEENNIKRNLLEKPCWKLLLEEKKFQVVSELQYFHYL